MGSSLLCRMRARLCYAESASYPARAGYRPRTTAARHCVPTAPAQRKLTASTQVCSLPAPKPIFLCAHAAYASSFGILTIPHVTGERLGLMCLMTYLSNTTCVITLL